MSSVDIPALETLVTTLDDLLERAKNEEAALEEVARARLLETHVLYRFERDAEDILRMLHHNNPEGRREAMALIEHMQIMLARWRRGDAF